MPFTDSHNLGKLASIELVAVLGHSLLKGGVCRVFPQCLSYVIDVLSRKNPAHLQIRNPAGDCRISAASEEDWAPNRQCTEEFRGYDSAGPFLPQADNVNIG